MAGNKWSGTSTAEDLPSMKCNYIVRDGRGESISQTVDARIQSSEFYHKYAKIVCPLPNGVKSASGLLSDRLLSNQFKVQFEVQENRFRSTAHRTQTSTESNTDEWRLFMRPIQVCISGLMETMSKGSETVEREGVSVCVRPISFQSLFSSTTTLNFATLLQWMVYHIEVLGVKSIYLMDR